MLSMADVLAVRDDYRAQTWTMLIQECSNSGLTKREFCRQRGISEKSLLLAPEAPRSDGRSCRASDRAAGIFCDFNGDSSDPIPGCRIEAAGRCGY